MDGLVARNPGGAGWGGSEHNNKKKPEEVDKQIAGRLKEFRKSRSMTQEQLAERLGITFQQIQKYERGTNRITLGRFFDIARALDLPPARFFDGLGGAEGYAAGFGETAAAPYLAQGADEADLALAYSRIEETEVRQAVLDLVRALAKGGGDGSTGSRS